MDIPPLVLEFFDLPSDSDDIDQYLQQDLSIDHQHQLTEGLGGSSPHLNDLDLDGAYWLANPARLDLLKQHFSRHPRAKQIDDNSDWVEDLFATPKCKQKTIPLPATSKAPLSTGSITEPESDDPIVMHVAPTITTPTLKAPLSTGSITEPESDDPPVAHVTPRSESDDLVTTSMNPGPKTMSVSESMTRLDRHCIFATPSPPPPGSIYWKYFTREEDVRWYDRSGTDKSFQVVRKMKQELQALFDT